ncbi:MAG: motB [Rhizobium sp.]|nr:motB [Rhizobium sp.]
MSEAESHHHGKNEIIIIKRHGGNHEGAHGGQWKIAYADFMTAMMAFFLIMWLVNAANEKTKAAVANYFNPIKLSDPLPAEKGLKKPAKDAEGENEQEKSKTEGKETSPGQQASQGEDQKTTAGEEVKYSDADYFENPYAVIAEISQEADDKANVSTKGEGGEDNAGPGTGADGGKAYRDPFDPDFWTQQVEVSRTSAADPSDKPAEISGLPGDGAIENGQNTDSAFTGQADKGDQNSGELKSGDLKAGEGLTDKDGLSDADKAGKSTKDKNGKADKDKAGKTDKDKNGQTAADQKLAAATKLAKDLNSELQKELKGRIGYLAEGLVVTPAEGGVLISITDQTKTPMFRVGSAIPTKETIVAMEEIGKLLKSRKGQIAIRGHTDARPYKTKGYDNWRLSADRAQSAYFMLKVGGVAEDRVSQISGFADHRLLLPKTPLDARNRRIEILLQADEG